jgi:hypothetical protein
VGDTPKPPAEGRTPLHTPFHQLEKLVHAPAVRLGSR